MALLELPLRALGFLIDKVGYLIFVLVIIYSLQGTVQISNVDTIVRTQLYESVMNSNIYHKSIFLSQVVHETNAFRSKVFRECNNLCGMKYTKNRTHAYGWCNGHAGYKPIGGNPYQASINDYQEWQHSYYLPWLEKHYPYWYKSLDYQLPPDEIYYEFLIRAGYAEDRAYVSKVKKWKSRLLAGNSASFLKGKE